MGVEGERLPAAPFAHSAAEIADALRVDAGQGLSQPEVERRREAFGANVVVRDAGRSLWSMAGRQFRSIVVALLAVAAAIAFATRDPAEGIAILGVLLINAVVGFAVEWRSERALESLRIQVRTNARVLRDGVQSMIDAEELVPGGTVVCAGIHMSDIRSFPYELLWNERTIRSVANLTRANREQFFRRIASLRIETKRTVYPLAQANEALGDLLSGKLTGTAVLSMNVAS